MSPGPLGQAGSESAANSPYQPGDEVVPGYTLIRPLGSGMAGDVWVGQAAGGIHVAIKIIRSLAVVGGRKELKALKTVRNVHHPNLCPVFGFWTKDEEGRVLEDGETERIELESSVDVRRTPPPTGKINETMSISSQATPVDIPIVEDETLRPDANDPSAEPIPNAQQLIVVMGLGDQTLHDRVEAIRAEKGLSSKNAEHQKVSCGMDPAEAVAFVDQSAGAIDLLNQEHQIYHCDIKPQNILVVGGGAQVCDFGLANKIEGDMRKTQTAFATPAYAAPEVLQGQTYDRSVDQYSLAVTYYELRTGLLPFDATTPTNMLMAKCTGKLDMTAVTAPERKVLGKAMAINPKDRFDSCSDFVRAMSIATGVTSRGGLSPKRIAALAAGLLVVSGLALGGWYTFDRPGFSAVFFPAAKQAANHLENAKSNLKQTDDKATLIESYSILTNAMSEAAQAAQNVEGDVQSTADQVFADAALRLAQRVHAALAADRTPSDNELSAAQRMLQVLDANDSASLSAASGLDDSKSQSLAWMRNRLKQVNAPVADRLASLVLVGKLVLATREGGSSDGSQLAEIRRHLDSGSLDADMETVGGVTRLAMLPILSLAGRGDVPDSHWVSGEVVGDVIRVERQVRRAPESLPASYRNTWTKTRGQFVGIAEPLVSADKLDPELAAQITQAFPTIRIDRLLVRTENAILANEWSSAADALDQIKTLQSSTSSSSHSSLTTVLTLVIDSITNPKRLQRLTTELKPLADTQSLNQRLQPSVQAVLDHHAQHGLRRGGRVPALQVSIEVFEAVAERFDVLPPLECYAAAILDRLHGRAIQDDDQELISAWVTKIAASERWPELAAAVRIDQLLGDRDSGRLVSDKELRRWIAELDTQPPSVVDDDAPLLDPVYREYLIGRGALSSALDLGEEDASALDRLNRLLQSSSAARLTEVLGQERMRATSRDYVRLAIQRSGVDDSDFVNLRYETDSAACQVLLDQAQAWAGASPPQTLAAESFLLQLRQWRADGDQTRPTLPTSLARRLSRDPDQAWPSLSVPMLRGLVEMGLYAQRPVRAPALNAIVLPANLELMRRFGFDRFDDLVGFREEKRRLYEEALLPTMAVVSKELEVNQDDELDVRLSQSSQLNRETLERFCAAFARATDNKFAVNASSSEYQHSVDFIQAAAFAAAGQTTDAGLRSALWLRAGTMALRVPSMSRDDQLAFRAADRAEQLGAAPARIALLRGKAYMTSAERNPGDPSNPQRMTSAQRIYESILNSKQVESISAQEKFDLLTNLGFL
ncbi:MAG: protein kinase, partial [Planctomycetota bacterium]